MARGPSVRSRILGMLEEGAATCGELSFHLGIKHNYIRRHISELHEIGVVKAERWVRGPYGHRIKMWEPVT